MKNANTTRPRIAGKKLVITPNHAGLIALAICAVLVWTGYFLLAGDWQIKEKLPNNSKQSARLELPTNEVAEKIFAGPQLPPASRSFYDYSSRLEEQTAILVSLTVTALHENLAFRRNPKDLPTLINQARAKNLSVTDRLWLAEWDKRAEIKDFSGWILTDRAVHYLYYHPAPFGIEIMTVSLTGDPQMTVARLPERAGSLVKVNPEFAPETASGAALFVSPPGSAKLLPPWSPTGSFEEWGWHREPLKIIGSSPERRRDINRWIAEQTSRR